MNPQQISRNNHNVLLWEDRNQRNAQWNFVFNEQRNAYVIHNVLNPDLVLSATTTGTSGNAFAYLFRGYNDQFWIVDSTNNGYILRNFANRNLVLDVTNSGTNNGTNITVHPFHNGNN
ncbi:hypothetical protein IGM_02196 [Bacillus cereus HuB4-4]|uniref:Ricin B lectin domain-containing protein n=1 Tax=Bacillus cereus HuB4-4 TaxID=1053211 RepID=A0A9W5QW79_BACCE|nr:RICIN domain-containing protein [Bacillus cereus]EOP90503.1 hypothetical protein IGM_02196 [Bacillus cereus HuB4-4]